MSCLPVFSLQADEPDKQVWKPANPVLMTRWGKTVTPENVLPEYPRPQMVRKEWRNLNGLWEFAIGRPEDPVPVGKVLSRQILVPFPMESALSGIRETADHIWYRRKFDVPAAWRGQRLLLHFGAVDWQAKVFVNGKEVGSHWGGYDPFSCDITDALTQSGPQELIVSVADPMRSQAAGKQSRPLFLKPRGSIFYECATGIWQTVWLEPVPNTYVASLKIVPDVDQGVVRVTVSAAAVKDGEDMRAFVDVYDGTTKVGSVTGRLNAELQVKVPGAKLWSPDSPFLYDLKAGVVSQQASRPSDEVAGYFAMRKVAIGKDSRGITRLLLNNQFTFMVGALDQGYWPDGIYTAPTDEALRFDIEFAKSLGLNLLRKHVKVEPERWYFWCDKLGMLVWQDMPAFSINTKGYEDEMPRIISARANHPCIALWVMSNESPLSAEQLTRQVAVARKSDPTRPVTADSGCPDFGIGDIKDRHDYPGPSSYAPTESQAVVLGEWAGTAGYVPGHDWFEVVLNKTYPAWSRDLEQKNALNHEKKMQAVWQLAYAPGLSASVWTQLTDIEGECNGFITYDRQVVRNDVARVAAANRGYVGPAALPDVRFHPKAGETLHGLFLDSQQVTLVTPRADGVIRYTLDSTEPDANSALYARPILLRDTTTIKAKSFWPDRPPSVTEEFLYRKVAGFQPATTFGRLEPGLACQYFRDQKVIDSAILPEFAFHPAPPFKRKPMDRYVWKGVISIPRNGLYTFARPAAEMKVVIGDNVLFDGNGGRNIHVGDWEAPAQIPLQAGYHRIEAEWIVSPATQYFVVNCPIQVEGPDTAKQPIPPAWLKHESP
jgi:hypothetical protein